MSPAPIERLMAQFLSIMQDCPPSRKPGSFNLGIVEERLKCAIGC
jgi:hypothetical protein